MSVINVEARDCRGPWTLARLVTIDCFPGHNDTLTPNTAAINPDALCLTRVAAWRLVAPRQLGAGGSGRCVADAKLGPELLKGLAS